MNYFLPKNHSNAVLLALFLANLMSVTTTWAVDYEVKGEIAPGIMRYTFQEDFKDVGSLDTKWQDNVPFLGIAGQLGATFYPGYVYVKEVNCFGDLYIQWADIGDDHIFQNASIGGQPASADWNIDFKRRDYIATLGVTIPLGISSDRFSVMISGGYKGSNAELNGAHRWIFRDRPANIQTEDSTILKTNGGFGGVGLTWGYNNFAVTGNLAYAWLNSHYDSNLNNIHEDGDNEGLTYGLKLQYTLPNSVSLTLSGDYYSYETGFTIREKGTQLNSVKEKMIPLRLSITYRFK